MQREIPGDELISLVRKAELFSGLLDGDLAYVASRVSLMELPAGARVVSPGDQALRFFIVRSGEIQVFRPEEGGGEREIARYLPGDVIGDFDFASGGVHDSSVRTSVASELLVFPALSLRMEDLAREKPDVAARILLRSLSMISSRLRTTHRLIGENAPWLRELRRQIYTDPGTGLWSKAFLDEDLPRSVEAPTALVFIKPDRFKELNDAHGHAAGDEAMARIAAALLAEVSGLGRGWALRLRSNETALVVPRCGRDEALSLARRLSSVVSALEVPIATRAGGGFSFTASLAMAVWPEDDPDWRRTVESAYSLLIRAWRDGGDRIYRLGRDGSTL